jgi:ABC-type nitrate/sulfonate/bicarbonate transport system permease component
MASAVHPNAARWYSVPLVLAIWEVLSRTGAVSRRLMPSLVEIAAAVWAALQNGDLLFHAGISLGRAATGYALAIAAGVLLGVAMARSRLFDALFEPLFSFGYPVPKIALYPVFIFVFGLGSLSKVMLIFLECLYPIAIVTYQGARNVNRVLIWSAQNMGASRARIFLRVVIPATVPFIFAGFRVALPVAMIVVIITEMINARSGLGFLIQEAENSLRFDLMYTSLLSIAVLGYAGDLLLRRARRRALAWQEPGA